jgi:acyl-homoserine-lactone acylase
LSDLPQAIDPPGGFVANSNNPPWTSTFPQTLTNSPGRFPAYVSPQFMDLRAQNGALFLQSKDSLSLKGVLAGKESTHMLLADRVLPDLISAAKLPPPSIVPPKRQPRFLRLGTATPTPQARGRCCSRCGGTW